MKTITTGLPPDRVQSPVMPRRSLLAGMPLLVAACAAPALAAPTIETADPGFAAVVNHFLEAHRVYQEFYKHHYGPADEAVKAETDAIGHYTTKRTFDGGRDRPALRLTTAQHQHCRIARDCKPTGLRTLSDFEHCCLELRGALDEREASIAKIWARHNYKALGKELDRLGDVKGFAMDAIVAYPVRTFADLVRKTELMAEDDYDEVRMDQLVTDLRTITGRA